MRNIKVKLLLSVSVAVLAASTAASYAATFTRIYKFPPKLKSGEGPGGQLTLGPDGSLYGVTGGGGDTQDDGTVFRITPEGRRVTLYSFGTEGTGDGADPNGGLVLDDAGNLYGTTVKGGVDGFGTVFKIAPDGTEAVLHSFGVNGNTFDGEIPGGALISDGNGNFLGVTADSQGRDTHGAIFKITPSGVTTILYYFDTSHKKGFEPNGRLLLDNDGTLYGATGGGGKYGLGTVFKFTTGGGYQTLYDFGASENDGAFPLSGLVQGLGGKLYGTTKSNGQNNLGTVYQVDLSGSEKTIFSFSKATGGNTTSELIADSDGLLYGTTPTGGVHAGGSVFKVTPLGKETTLHSFKGPDGYAPFGALIFDNAGSLYGTASGVGDPKVNYGTVFKITP